MGKMSTTGETPEPHRRDLLEPSVIVFVCMVLGGALVLYLIVTR